jgi:hypothetical protein
MRERRENDRLEPPPRLPHSARLFNFYTFLLRGAAKAVLYCAHRTSTASSCALCEQEDDQSAHLCMHRNDPSKLACSSLQGWGLIDLPLRASNEGLRRPRVARAKKIISLHHFLLILPIELLHHLIGHIQGRLMIEHDSHQYLVPLVDDRDIPIPFPHGLCGRLHFF